MLAADLQQAFLAKKLAGLRTGRTVHNVRITLLEDELIPGPGNPAKLNVQITLAASRSQSCLLITL